MDQIVQKGPSTDFETHKIRKSLVGQKKQKTSELLAWWKMKEVDFIENGRKANKELNRKV